MIIFRPTSPTNQNRPIVTIFNFCVLFRFGWNLVQGSIMGRKQHRMSWKRLQLFLTCELIPRIFRRGPSHFSDFFNIHLFPVIAFYNPTVRADSSKEQLEEWQFYWVIVFTRVFWAGSYVLLDIRWKLKLLCIYIINHFLGTAWVGFHITCPPKLWQPRNFHRPYSINPKIVHNTVILHFTSTPRKPRIHAAHSVVSILTAHCNSTIHTPSKGSL